MIKMLHATHHLFSDSTSGSRKARSSKKHAQKQPTPLPRAVVATKDEGVQTDDCKELRTGESTDAAELPKDALDLLSDGERLESDKFQKDFIKKSRTCLTIIMLSANYSS